nr:MAG TPA: hypothetical protein [Caudoviricetes sp.]
MFLIFLNKSRSRSTRGTRGIGSSVSSLTKRLNELIHFR